MKIFEIINNVIVGLTVIFLLMAFTFKTLHWPGATLLLSSTLLLGILSTILVVTLRIIKVIRS